MSDASSSDAKPTESTKKARIRLAPSFWTHDFGVPFSDDVQPSSLFLRNRHYLVVDIETQKTFDEVGGKEHFDKLGISVACAYDSKTGEFLSYTEDKIPELNKLCKERLVVGYNIVGFDLKVMAAYGLDSRKLDIFDIMLDVQNTSGQRFVSLDKIARATIGSTKSADGLQAVAWYREGKIDEIIKYCLKDVEITRDVFIHGMKHGNVKIARVEGEAKVVPVQWN